MRTPANLAEAVTGFGEERVYRNKRRKQGSGRVHHVREWCVECDKWGYQTQNGARQVISRMLANEVLGGPNSFCFAPYKCPHAEMWHNGHDMKTKRLIDEAMRTEGAHNLSVMPNRESTMVETLVA